MDNVKNKSSYTKDEILNFDFEISHDDAFLNLFNENCDDFKKIFSILSIDKFQSQDEADIFLFHLTNHSNPVREAVAYKLTIFDDISCSYFIKENNLNQLILALIDINPNVCRSVCDFLSKNIQITAKIKPKLIEKLNFIETEIKEYEKNQKDYFDKKIKNTKNHAKNKLLFSMYWLLEALSCSEFDNNNDEIFKILSYTINFSDYTIREKTAKILAKMPNVPFDLLQKANSDQNFYVKNQVYGKINFED